MAANQSNGDIPRQALRWVLPVLFPILIGFICAGVSYTYHGYKGGRVRAAVQETLPFYADTCQERIYVTPEPNFLFLFFPFLATTWDGGCLGVSDAFFSVNLLTCEVTTVHFQGNTTYDLAWCP